jgi:aspartate racemase
LNQSGENILFFAEAVLAGKIIGVIGGMSPESTADFYKLLMEAYDRKRGDSAYPETIIYSVNFKKFLDVGYEAADEVSRVIRVLAGAGADFAVMPCNSGHIIYDRVGSLPIPWFSIVDAVGRSIRREGIKRVGLLGTKFTAYGGIYRFDDIEVINPGKEDLMLVNNIIYSELVHGKLTGESRKHILEVIKRLKAAGSEGVILGCTELPLLVRPEDTAIKLFSSTEILAKETLKKALE